MSDRSGRSGCQSLLLWISSVIKLFKMYRKILRSFFTINWAKNDIEQYGKEGKNDQAKGRSRMLSERAKSSPKSQDHIVRWEWLRAHCEFQNSMKNALTISYESVAYLVSTLREKPTAMISALIDELMYVLFFYLTWFLLLFWQFSHKKKEMLMRHKKRNT